MQAGGEHLKSQEERAACYDRLDDIRHNHRNDMDIITNPLVASSQLLPAVCCVLRCYKTSMKENRLCRKAERRFLCSADAGVTG